MIICLIFVLTLFVGNLQYREVVTTDYLTHRETRITNGVFVMCVFMSHFTQYLPRNSEFLYLYLPFKYFMKQLVVTTFLFFSGYGVFRSLNARGRAYLSNFFVRRWIPFLLNAWIALSLFLVYQVFVKGNAPSLQHLLLSFCFLKNFSNSNWYIFAMLYLYLAFYVATYLCLNKRGLSITLLALLLLVYVLFINTFLKSFIKPCWYNTIFAFFAGSLFGTYKERFDSFLFPSSIFSNTRYLWLWAATLTIFLLSHHYMSNKGYGILSYEIASATFPFLFVLLNIKFRFTGVILDYLGRHVFSIYILQRLCFMEFARLGYSNNPWLYFALSLIGTLIVSYIFDEFINKLPYNKGKIKQMETSRRQAE